MQYQRLTYGSRITEVNTPLWGIPPARASRLTALALRLALDARREVGLALTAI
jgi:hypothetical protein